MLNKFFKYLVLALIFPTLGFSTNPTVVADEIELTVNGAGEILDVFAPKEWTNGDINSFYLDNTHTQKTFNNIRLKPGKYRWTLKTIKRNGKKGKVNLDIVAKYKNGSNSRKLDRKFSPDRTDTGMITLEDYNSQSGGSAANYTMVKVHIGRAAINTNVRYKITLKWVTSTHVVDSGGSASTDDCSYTNLGSKNGNVIGNTVGKFSSTKKACKTSAKVLIKKTGGKARTTVMVYVSNTKNGTGTLKTSYEFPNGNKKGQKELRITGVKNKFVRVEVKNRSAANTFKYSLWITQ